MRVDLSVFETRFSRCRQLGFKQGESCFHRADGFGYLRLFAKRDKLGLELLLLLDIRSKIGLEFLSSRDECIESRLRAYSSTSLLQLSSETGLHRLAFGQFSAVIN